MSGRPKLPVGTWGNINVRPNDSGKFIASARQRLDNGSIVRKSVVGNTAAAAKRELQIRLSTEAEKGNASGSINRYSTVEQLVNYWLEGLLSEDLAPSSIERYKVDVKHLVIPQLGKLQLQELDPTICDRWLREHLKKSTSRAKRGRNVLRQSLALAKSLRAITENPLSDLRRIPSSPVPPPRSLTKDEMSLVRQAVLEPARRKNGVGGPRPDDRLICLVDLLIATGARIGEALALRRCDFDFEGEVPLMFIRGTLSMREHGRQVRSNKTKTPSSTRTIPISPYIVSLVKNRLKATDGKNEETLIFETKNGTPWASCNVGRRLRKALNQAGLAELQVHPHLFRKTAATEIDKKYGVRAAASMLGHSSTAITEKHYLARSSVVDTSVALSMMDFAEPLLNMEKADE